MPIRSTTRAPWRSRLGLSLIEVLLAIAVITVAVVGTVGTIAATAKLSTTDEETMLATQGARILLEQLEAAEFGSVFALYNQVGSDDPAGPDTGPGAHFDIAGLAPTASDADGRVGRVQFPVPPGQNGALRENTVEPTFGMPRDLNLDGAIDELEHAGDYRVLPVRVRVTWFGMDGERALEFDTVLTSR